MSEPGKVTIESNGPEEVAFKLVTLIRSSDETGAYKSKEAILTLYSECLLAAWYPGMYLRDKGAKDLPRP
jgi:hypothetical protein